MNHHNETLYRVALKNIPKVGAVIARNLVSYCGSVEAVFRENPRHLLRVPGVGPKLVSSIRQKSNLLKAEEELRFIEKHDIQLHFYLDDCYPERLRHISQAPILMYSKGTFDLNAERIISIVGTRQATNYGKLMCARIIRDLAIYNPVVVSGLAYGIDITAHREAVARNLSTVAVLGNGLGRIYPSQHRSFTKTMTKHGGLLTEFGFETPPDKENFPSRNRIIAGLADVIIVVESAESGGSIITAEFANSYNRDVAAIPGRGNDEMSAGCNKLIKTHKAHLVESGADIARLLSWDDENNKPAATQSALFADLSEEEQLLLELMKDGKEAGLDILSLQSKMSLGELATVLLSLEFKGVVQALPGKRFLRLN
ncbi:MAG: DNA-protecting protein DprA [Bacteroidetes bacterium]|nr:MAG: DNA-protecting protein DprA [Bacteroidota bacterium]